MAAAAGSNSAPPHAGTRARRGRGRGRSLRWSRSPRRRPTPTPAQSPPPPPVADPDPAPLPPGAEVEVRVDDDGFHGSWFEATVLDFAPARGRRRTARYTVRYAHLLADDDGSVLAEPFAPSHIRPRPPPPPPESDSFPPRFHAGDIVEAFHHDGWWSGIVTAAPDSPDPDASVTVAFPITREVIQFPPRLVRPRRDYVDGHWVPSPVAMVVRPRHKVKVYKVGEKVEVERYRDVFGNSWFPAKVARVVDDLSYVVEYIDLEEEGQAGPEKATEYLHWCFIRPADEHVPCPREFQLVPGAAVEAYCDGAWSPGVVHRVLEDGEYEVRILGKKADLLVTKVVELLKLQYKWNGNRWRIATVKKRAKSRRWSMLGKSPSSPIDVTSSGEEHNHDPDSSPTKKSRKELKQLDNTITEGPKHASVSEMDTPLSSLCKSPVLNCLPSEKNSPQVVQHGIVNSVPMNGHLSASSGHSVPVDNQEILSDMVLDGQLNKPVSGASDAHDIPSISELRRKMASARRNSAAQQTEKKHVKSLRVKKCTSKIKVGKTRPIQELQGKVGPNTIQLNENMNNSSNDIVCALSVSVEGQTNLSPNKQVSMQTRRGSRIKALACKKLANRRGSKELCSPDRLLDVTSTVQQRGRKVVAEPMKECPLASESPKSATQEELDRTLEDAQNITELSNQEDIPMVPPGFESMYNREGDNIQDTQLEVEPTAMANGLIQPNGNDHMCTDHAATKVAKSNHETAILSLDYPVHQSIGKVGERSVLPRLQNAGSSQRTIDSSPLRSCSSSELAPSQISDEQVSFVKSSVMWPIIEAMHVFKELPQQPHFLPLRKFAPTLCEGMALGLMVSFVEIVKDVREAKIDNSMEWFQDKISTICHLERNGFSVQSMQIALHKLVEIKSNYTNSLGEMDKLKAEIVGKTTSVSRIDALLNENDRAIAELEQKLGRLRQESQRIAEEKEEEDADLSRLKVAYSSFEETCADAEQEFRSALGELRRRQLT